MTRDMLRENGMFGVRVGLHHGIAVEREGDYFGATVNLAARVSSLAAGGEVLMTGQTAVLVPDLDGVVSSRAASTTSATLPSRSRSSRRCGPATWEPTSCRSTPSVEWPSILTAQLDDSLTRGRCTTSARCRVLVTSRAIPSALQARRISRTTSLAGGRGGPALPGPRTEPRAGWVSPTAGTALALCR